MVFSLHHVQFPITALREIKILQLLKHENVVNLIEICRTKGELAGQRSYPRYCYAILLIPYKSMQQYREFIVKNIQ